MNDGCRTRLYNQPVDHYGNGLYYRHGIHCAWQLMFVDYIYMDVYIDILSI